MNTPGHYAETTERNISSAVTREYGEFAEATGYANVYALLAIAAAIDRLADAVLEIGTPPTYRRRT
jgi:hypothetical protein